ncbi:alpha/beta fold hydrolase [Candidatus Woesearchaeota archaeon]|nr:alpha/beta fold hydrolase [Candidatus Woesearchaeota archaeon]
MKEVWKSYIRNHKKKFILLAIILIIVLFVSGTQLVLYLNFLLGNDLIIGLTSEQETITLRQGESKSVGFNVEVRSNPFCQISCRGVFTQSALQKIVKEEVFNVLPGMTMGKRFVIASDAKTEGKEMYKYDVECNNVNSWLCHTSEDKIMRSAVVIVNHELSEEEKNKRQSLGQTLQEKAKKLEMIQSKLAVWQDFSVQIADLQLKQEIDSLMVLTVQEKELLVNWQELWEEQEVQQIEKELEKDTLLEIKNEEARLDSYVKDSLGKYAFLKTELLNIKQLLENSPVVLNESLVLQKKALINYFKNLAVSGYYDNKLNEAAELKSKAELLNNNTWQEVRKEVVKNEVNLYVASQAWCKINNNCWRYKNIKEIAESENHDLKASCEEIKQFRDSYDEANKGNKGEDKVPALVYEINQEIINSINWNDVNYELIMNNLPAGIKGDIGNYSEIGLDSLNKIVPERCSVMELEVMNISFNDVSLKEQQNISLGILFEEPKKLCCALNRCSFCCENDNCKNDLKYTPIIFIHGHAFNKDVSTEYSLNAFNVLQSKLEQEGYLNAGVLNVYAPNGEAEDWSGFNIPVTLKASYYYDAYEASGKYTLIQQKSERIDNYAIRLKEIIDNVQYRTGRSKVIIIAHSMGGLVSRRYMQVFGDDNVEKLIMIGTPNKGIVGDVSSYCDVLGEQRECEDMNSESVFMQKLNSVKKLKKVKLYTIIGQGCEMDYNGQKADGDGVVLAEKVELEEAKKYYINGHCEGIRTLHSELLDVNKYPQVYKDIVRILQE